MAQTKQQQDLTANPNVVSVISANPGLTFSAEDLDAMQRGDLVIVGQGALPTGPGSLADPSQFPFWPSFPRGCITQLRYGTSSDDLDYLEVDGVGYWPVNLKDFREVLGQAACCGHKISFCWFKSSNTMRMLNVYPCKCCDDQEHD